MKEEPETFKQAMDKLGAQVKELGALIMQRFEKLLTWLKIL